MFAPSPEVYDALLEYDKFAELSDSFTESRFIEPAPDGSPRIYTKIEGCILFFCKTVNRYARLELEPKWKITAIAEPELSDAELDRLHAPVGLPIGSKTPPEIAVAILAEITAVKAGVRSQVSERLEALSVG